MSGRERILTASVLVLAAMLAGMLVAQGLEAPIAMLGRLPLLRDWLAPEAVNVGHPDGLEPEYWTCSMHPSVHRDHEGPCPICGMDLIPVYPENAAPGESGTADGADMQGMPGMPGMAAPPAERGDRDPASRSTFRVAPEWQQAVGVRTAPVERRALERSLRFPGRVAVDETRLVDVNLKTSGWIERLHVEESGQYVRAGETLLELYSPELVTAQRELLLALEGARALGDSTSAEARSRSEALVEASRRRIRRLGLSESVIERVESGGGPQETLPFLAPSDGYVLEKMAVEGMRVEPGMRLFRIADLSTVWVLVDVYEGDAAFVRPGQSALFRLAYDTDKAWRGRVDYVYPTLDSASRSLRVRLVVRNPGLELRPEMYGDAVLDSGSPATLAVPADAVIDLGTRRVVFVDLGQGRLQAREVIVGPETGGWHAVRAGLAEGDPVVVSGNFLIDAESKIRGVVPLPAEEGR